MKTSRRWLLLLLLGVLVDLANPALPGVFSLLNGDLFMDGVTRMQGSAEARSVRECPRVPPAADPLHAVMAVARPSAPAVRDGRRASERSGPRRAMRDVAAPVSSDTEDH